jgi:hypothetical protein
MKGKVTVGVATGSSATGSELEYALQMRLTSFLFYLRYPPPLYHSEVVCASSSLNCSLLHDTVLSYSAALCGPRAFALTPADLLQSVLDSILHVVRFAVHAVHFGLSLSRVFDQRTISEGLGITILRIRNFGPDGLLIRCRYYLGSGPRDRCSAAAESVVRGLEVTESLHQLPRSSASGHVLPNSGIIKGKHAPTASGLVLTPG